jgi:hypothetical protein
MRSIQRFSVENIDGREENRNMEAIHYVLYSNEVRGRVPCGRPAPSFRNGVEATTDWTEVTCKTCLRTSIVAQSFHRRGRDNYAVARWSVDDVHEYRSDNEMPEWTDDQASDFLAGAEGNIQDRMIEAGWEALETLIRMAEEDEDVDQEA